VYSLASAFDEILAARKEVVIANGHAEGLRLRDDLVTYGLASGDVLVAVDGQRLTAVEQLAPSLQKAKARTRLLIARLRRFGTIELVEH
jgi:urease accessory protein UreE